MALMWVVFVIVRSHPGAGEREWTPLWQGRKGETHLHLEAVYSPALQKTVIWKSVLKCWKHGIVTTCGIFILLWLRRTWFNFKQKPEHVTWNFLVLTQSLITSSFLLCTCSASPPTNGVPRFASCVTVLTYTVCVFHGPMFLWKPKLYLSGPEGVIGIHLINTADRLFHFYYLDSYTDCQCSWQCHCTLRKSWHCMTMSGFAKGTKILHYNQWPYIYMYIYTLAGRAFYA